MSDNLETLETNRDNAEHAGDVFKIGWMERFTARFTHRMKANGYHGDDLAEVVKQHADATWGARDEVTADVEPEDAADGEYDALADSV